MMKLNMKALCKPARKKVANGCVQERGAVEERSAVKSEESYAQQVKKVQRLKTQPGYIVNQIDSEIATKMREYAKE